MGVAAQGLVRLVKGNMVDGEMVEWLMPGFSTTSEHDRATAAMVVLGVVKQFFSYVVTDGCGFPSVTLEGERSDWADLVGRVGRFAMFGEEAGEWARCLGKAVEGMLGSFDRPEDEQVKEFWMKACHSAGAEGSGEAARLSGWLTAFCWWTAAGSKQIFYEKEDLLSPDGWRTLEIDGVVFPVMSRDAIPAASTRASITCDDGESGAKRETVLVAGLTGMKLVDDTGSSVRPASGWWILMGDPAL